MEKVAQYRQYVLQLLTKYANYQPSGEEIEVELIFDAECVGAASPQETRYQILEISWDKYDRIYNRVMHLDIKNEKIPHIVSAVSVKRSIDLIFERRERLKYTKVRDDHQNLAL
ncbi:MAG: XisI protein [Cyanosarcina radialis HA8281-LM2]|jgi:predicted RNA-binding protein with PIN domain|nr:XisI protein [Cyanosarcina radialis HA8281-LM2]